MPYEKRREGDKVCIFKKGTDKKFGCHDSEEEADAQLKALYAKEPDATTAAATDHSTGIMVAVYPPTDIAASLAIEGGEPAESLHVTLAYIGTTDEVAITDELLASVLSSLSEVALSHRPLTGSIGGRGEFPPGDDGTPIWIPVDTVGLDELRVDVVRALDDVGLPAKADHGFTPHMTLGYATDESPLNASVVPLQEVTFGSLVVKVGEETREIPLGEPETREEEPSINEMAASVLAHAAENAYRPPAEFFTDPGFTQLQRYTTITAEGRVMFHVAGYDECHIGYENRCITLNDILPGGLEYAYAGGGVVVADSGDTIRTSAVTVTNGHADIALPAKLAKEHYDDPAHAFADVVYGLDEFGLWASGALRPTATEEQVYMARASAVSLDAREIDGMLRYLGACCVNRPGLPKVKMRMVASASGEEHVAAVILTGDPPADCEPCREQEWEALTASIDTPALERLAAELV